MLPYVILHVGMQQCGDAPPPEVSGVPPEELSGLLKYDKMTVEYSCPEGEEMSGPGERTCGEEGEWVPGVGESTSCQKG